jgi:hypothetical protein
MWVEYESKSNHIQPVCKAAQKENYPFSISAGWNIQEYLYLCTITIYDVGMPVIL